MKQKIIFLKDSFLKFCKIKEDECQISIFGTSIYELYDLLNKKENIDSSLPAILYYNKYIKGIPYKDIHIDSYFTEIYLIFDFDPQYHKFSIEKITKLIKRFNNETEEGRLLLNYPMFESLYDIDDINEIDNANIKVVDIQSSDEYKKTVRESTIIRQNNGNMYKRIPLNKLNRIKQIHLLKYLALLGLNQFPSKGINDLEILLKELVYLRKRKIYVLNVFILLAFNYL